MGNPATAPSSQKEVEMKDNFKRELRNIINKYSKDNDSNTPDFILGQFLEGCLFLFTIAVQQRETCGESGHGPLFTKALESGYGRDPKPPETKGG